MSRVKSILGASVAAATDSRLNLGTFWLPVSIIFLVMSALVICLSYTGFHANLKVYRVLKLPAVAHPAIGLVCSVILLGIALLMLGDQARYHWFMVAWLGVAMLQVMLRTADRKQDEAGDVAGGDVVSSTAGRLYVRGYRSESAAVTRAVLLTDPRNLEARLSLIAAVASLDQPLELDRVIREGQGLPAPDPAAVKTLGIVDDMAGKRSGIGFVMVVKAIMFAFPCAMFGLLFFLVDSVWDRRLWLGGALIFGWAILTYAAVLIGMRRNRMSPRHPAPVLEAISALRAARRDDLAIPLAQARLENRPSEDVTRVQLASILLDSGRVADAKLHVERIRIERLDAAGQAKVRSFGL